MPKYHEKLLGKLERGVEELLEENCELRRS